MAGPNILFILTDQQSTGFLGCYGARECRTPHADALAAEGVRFDNAYAACPICTPARASIHTGLYPFRHGMQTNIYTRGCMVHELVDQPGLLSRRLQSLGYQTGLTGKWHLGFGDKAATNPEYEFHVHSTPMLGMMDRKGCLPSDVGFEGDDFPGHGGDGSDMPQYRAWLKERGIELKTRPVVDHYPETYEVLSGTQSTVSWFLTDQAIRHMESFRKNGQPFFYMLNFWGPHSPYHASSEYVDLYRDMVIPKWESFDEDQSQKPGIHNAHRTEHLRGWQWESFQEIIRYCYAAVTEIDAQVGRLVAWLKQTGQYDNTLILFASDHGDSLGMHRGLTDKALFMYEETNRIPLIIRDPALPARAGTTEDHFAGTCDLYSTILDYAGLGRDEAELDGRSLKPLLEGAGVDWRDCIVTESSGLDFLQYTQRALRYRNFKYVFNCGDIDELYDLENDPYELVNLAVDPARAALLLDMRLRLDRWLGKMNDGLQERFRRLRNLA